MCYILGIHLICDAVHINCLELIIVKSVSAMCCLIKLSDVEHINFSHELANSVRMRKYRQSSNHPADIAAAASHKASLT